MYVWPTSLGVLLSLAHAHPWMSTAHFPGCHDSSSKQPDEVLDGQARASAGPGHLTLLAQEPFHPSSENHNCAGEFGRMQNVSEMAQAVTRERPSANSESDTSNQARSPM